MATGEFFLFDVTQIYRSYLLQAVKLSCQEGARAVRNANGGFCFCFCSTITVYCAHKL